MVARGFEITKDLRRRFARGSPIVVALELCAALLRSGHDLLDILPRVADAMVTHGKAITQEQLMSVTKWVHTIEGPPAAQAWLLTTYFSLHAFGRLATGQVAEVGGLTASMRARKVRQDLKLEGPLEILLAEAAVVATSKLSDDDDARIARADTGCFLASALSSSPLVSQRERGLELMQQHIDALARLLAKPGPLSGKFGGDLGLTQARFLHAQATGNLAQAWSTRSVGDPETNLRRAVELFDVALLLPARKAEPPSYQNLLQQAIAAHRDLATVIQDVDDARTLLVRGVALADEAVALPAQFPHKEFHWHEPTMLAVYHVRMRALMHRREHGSGDTAVIREQLDNLADEALAFLATATRRGEPYFAHAVTTFQRMRAGEHTSTAPDTGFVRALAGRLTAEGRKRLTEQEAETLLATLVAWRNTPWPIELWQKLTTVMAAVHPREVGCDTARRLFMFELVLLRTLEDLDELERSLDRLQAGLADIAMSDEQRRVFAGALRGRAGLRLSWLARHPCDPVDLLVYCDNLGSATYRADSGFYGQGPAHELGATAESVWRTDLYRVRWDVDRAAMQIGVESLMQAEPTLPASLQPLLMHLAEERTIDPHGNISPSHHGGDPREVLAVQQDDLLAALRRGGAHGWRPARGQQLPVAYADELGPWLCERPSLAVLLDVPDTLLTIVTAAADGRPAIHTPFESLTSDVKDRFVAALQAFGDSRGLLISPPDANFATALMALMTAAHPVIAEIRRCCEALGVRALVVLSRSSHDSIPWDALFAEHDTGEPLPLVHAPTLAVCATLPTAVRPGSWTVLGAPAGSDPDLDVGWSTLRAIGTAPESGPDFATFERRAAEVGVLRLFMHGEFWPLAPLSGFALHAPLTRIGVRFQAKDIVMMDLTGCGRVECWACDASTTADMLGTSRGEDEGRNLATAFMLAGARSVVGARWQQPSAAAALIAAGFVTHAPAPGDAIADARTLARALRRYREVVARPDLATAHGWRAALATMIGVDPSTLPDTGPAPTLRIDDMRANYAWAGWRVSARDRSCLTAASPGARPSPRRHPPEDQLQHR